MSPTPAGPAAADKLRLLSGLCECMASPAFLFTVRDAERDACLAFVDAAVPASAVRGAVLNDVDLRCVAYCYFAAFLSHGDFRAVVYRPLREALGRHLVRVRGR